MGHTRLDAMADHKVSPAGALGYERCLSSPSNTKYRNQDVFGLDRGHDIYKA